LAIAGPLNRGQAASSRAASSTARAWFTTSNWPLGVTGTHSFWSVDRNDWVSASDLKIGETLKTLTGTIVVESMTQREETETVYNIEVETDHVYRVGDSGVLVHNVSFPGLGTYRGMDIQNDMPKIGNSAR
jgi:hypothetical protein